ncbi:MAG: restriction endonuclease subunit S, partial [Betaproteobacteria bacterium]|nr:restriction endonuclease subunit S [Betaproteobacteria bacterium]
MTGWQATTTEYLINEGLLKIGDGYRAKNSEFTSTGFPFARAGNINNGFLFSNADHLPTQYKEVVGDKISETGDVVFTSKGTVGRFGFVTEKIQKFVYSPQLCFWRSLKRDKIISKFIYYWMHGDEFVGQADVLKGQTDMADYVNLADQRRMKITLPPPSEQKAIAAVLSSLDDKIDLLHRQNATLEAMAEALFRQWFVVEAKEEWESTHLSYFGKIVCGKTPSKANKAFFDGEIPF